VRRRIAAFVKKVVPLRRRALVFQWLVPRRFWFSGVLLLSRCVARIARIAGSRECARYEAFSVDGWLAELTLGGPFPVKYRVDGAQHLVRTADDETGILYCGVHLPLTGVMMRAFLELGAAPDFVLAAPHNINPNGQWLPAGMTQGLNAVPPGRTLLRRVRTVLSEGGTFASMMDEAVGAPLRPTLMRLAGSVRARIIFSWAVMDASRTVVVTYRPAPHPVPDTEEKVLANLAVLDEQRQRVLASLRGQYWGRDE
jgi:hypothetical protein